MIQTDDIGGFFLELRIVTGNIAAQSMRLQPSFGQDARYPDVVGAKFGGNLASRPMRRSISRFALSQSQHSGLESNAFFAASPSTMPAVEATETFPNKALFPQSNRVDAAAHPPTGMGLTVAGRQTQNDLRAHGLEPLFRSEFGLDSPVFFSPAAKSQYVQTPFLSTIMDYHKSM
jgi:hypothetical protein